MELRDFLTNVFSAVLRKVWPILVFVFLDWLELYERYAQNRLPEPWQGWLAVNKTWLVFMLLAIWLSAALIYSIWRAIKVRRSPVELSVDKKDEDSWVDSTGKRWVFLSYRLQNYSDKGVLLEPVLLLAYHQESDIIENRKSWQFSIPSIALNQVPDEIKKLVSGRCDPSRIVRQIRIGRHRESIANFLFKMEAPGFERLSSSELPGNITTNERGLLLMALEKVTTKRTMMMPRGTMTNVSRELSPRWMLMVPIPGHKRATMEKFYLEFHTKGKID